MELASAQEDASSSPLLDAESLHRISQYVNELYTKRTFGASSDEDDDDSNDELISLGSIDIETVQSMEKLIRVLSQEDEQLAHELEGIISTHRHQQQQQASIRPNIRQETLASIGNYINAFSKTSYLHKLAAVVVDSANDDDDDDCSTLPGTVVLENEHPDMLKSISNYIDYTLAVKDHQLPTSDYEMDNDFKEVPSHENATANDKDSDNDTTTSSQVAEFRNDKQISADSADEASTAIEEEDNDTATNVSDDLTAQISPETLSQIGAFIDLVAQRNKKAVIPPANSNAGLVEKTGSDLDGDNGDDDVDDDVVNTILDELSMSDEEVLTQFSDDDASLALKANPDLLASVEAYIDNLAKTSVQSTEKHDVSGNLQNVTDHFEQLSMDGRTDDDENVNEFPSQILGAVNELNCIDHDHVSVPSYLMQRKGEFYHLQTRNNSSSSDPPANFISVRSQDDENDTSEIGAKPSHDPQPLLSTNLPFDTAVVRSALLKSNDQEQLKNNLCADATGAHLESNDGERNTQANGSRSCRDPELSTELVFDTTGEINRVGDNESDSRDNLQAIEESRFDTSIDQAKPRTRMGGPEILLTSGLIAKSKNEYLEKDNDCGNSAEELVSQSSKKENDECMLRVPRRGPPSPEKKNHQKGNNVKVLDEELGSRQIQDVTNGTASKAESPRPNGSEAEVKRPSGTEAQHASDIQTLATLITGIKNPSVDDERTMKRFAQFCYPLVGDKEPRAASVSEIMCEAGEIGLPLDAADRFLSLAQLVLDERRRNIEIEAAPSDEVRSPHLSSTTTAGCAIFSSRDFEAFVSRLVEAGTQNPQFMSLMEDKDEIHDFDDDKAYVDILVNSGSGGEDGADAIEVDLLCGALTSNDRRNGHDHWQTFAAKLLMSDSGNDLDDISSTSSDYVDKPPSQTHSGQLDPPAAENSARQHDQGGRVITGLSFEESVKLKKLTPGITPGQTEDTFDRHIMKFWKEQHTVKKKRFGYPTRTVRSLAESYSNDDNDTLSFITGSHASSFDMMEDAWIIRRSMAMYGKQSTMGWDEPRKVMVADVHPPKALDAVQATAKFFHRGSFLKRSKVDLLTSVWKETYVVRTAAHPGYLDVHINSLYAATSCCGERNPRDSLPWESRHVKQRFLHEQSVSFCKNWFGILVPRHKNLNVDQPVCRPDSFPMPVAAGEWTQEWYKKKTLAPIKSNLSGSVAGDPGNALELSDFFPDEESDDDSLYAKAPQCGRIRNMKLKIGEKITRVTPDLTSSLRRSRWRKRHFPRGTFPYK